MDICIDIQISLRGVLDLWSAPGAELVPEGLQRVTVPLLTQQPSEIIESVAVSPNRCLTSLLFCCCCLLFPLLLIKK